MLKKVVAVLVVGIFSASTTLWAAIHRTEVMLDPVGAIDSDTVLVVGLDNTVFEAAQMLGSAQWFEYLHGAYQKSGLSGEQAYQQALSQWRLVQNATEVRPVEPATPNFLRGVQSMGIKVIAITARPPQMAQRTLEQLSAIGVDFSRSPVFSKDVEMAFKRSNAVYTNGVIFADRLDKGGVMAAFFDRIKIKPRRVVYVDDDLNNVKSMQKAMGKLGVAYDGYRYGGADVRVKAFDPEVAELQFKYFGKILSDDAATQIRILAE